MWKKIPWGIIAGVCAILFFFATLAVVALYVINSGVAAQTNQTATIFATWYQTLIFIVDIIVFLGFGGSFTMYILKVKNKLPDTELPNRDKENTV